jgi:hypothetical protein
LIAAITLRYHPVEVPPVEVVEPEPVATGRRVASTAHIAAGVAAGADLQAVQVECAPYYDAFVVDSAKVTFKPTAKAGSRYAGMLVHTPSGPGVANYTDASRLTLRMRHYLHTVKGLEFGGVVVPELKWYASRGPRFGPGGKDALEVLDILTTGKWEVAQYPDLRFRLAAPGTPGVRFIRTDNAAYTAYNNAASGAAVRFVPTNNGAVADSALPPGTLLESASRPAPKAPGVQADPATGAIVPADLTKWYTCVDCGTNNVSTRPFCRTCSRPAPAEVESQA